jgi:hypothetical protein
MILYNKSERSHAAPKTWTDNGGSEDLLNPVRSGSMLVSSPNSRGAVGFGTRDGSKYAKAEILRIKRTIRQALILDGQELGFLLPLKTVDAPKSPREYLLFPVVVSYVCVVTKLFFQIQLV